MKKILLSFIFLFIFSCFYKYTSIAHADSLDNILMNNEIFENTSDCIECKIINPIFLSVSQFSYIIYNTFQTVLIIFLIFSISYWLLMFMWNKLKVDGEQIENLDFFKDIFKQMLKISIALIILYSSPQFLLKWTVEPMMNASSFITQKFLDISRLSTGNNYKIKFSDTKYNITGDIKNKQALPDGIRTDLINIIENYSATYKYGMIFGLNILKVTIQEGLTYEAIIVSLKFITKIAIEAVLASFGVPVAVTDKVLNYIDKIATASKRIIGIIYLLVAIIGAMIFAIYFFVLLKILTIIAGFILNIGLAIILLPFAVLSWALKDINIKTTNDLFLIRILNNLNITGIAKTIFIGWISNLAMLSIILTFCSYILETLLTIETTIAGQTMTLKEYILLNSNYFMNPIKGGNIINIIWQNMDITLVFICFGLIVSYLIKNVPVYTQYFFEPVTNIDFSEKLWNVFKGLFGKVIQTTGKTIDITKQIVDNTKKIVNSYELNDIEQNTISENEEKQPIITKKIKQTIQSTSALLKIYFSLPKELSRINKYSNKLKEEDIFTQKNNFKKINSFIKDGIKELSEQDNNIIKNYYNDKKRNYIKKTYNNLSEKGKINFINLLNNTLSDNDIENIARMIISKKAEKLYYKKNNIKNNSLKTKKQRKELNDFIEEEIKKSIFLYTNNIRNINLSDKSFITKDEFIDTIQQLSFDKNYINHLNNIKIDNWKEEHPFPRNNNIINMRNLLDGLKTSSEKDILIDTETEIRNIPKLTVLNEQKLIIKTIIDNLKTNYNNPIDYSNLSDSDKKRDYYIKKLQKEYMYIDKQINNINEDYDLEYEPKIERIQFYKKIMNNPIARKFLRENHIDRKITQLINELKNINDSEYDLDSDIIDLDNNDDEDE